MAKRVLYIDDELEQRTPGWPARIREWGHDVVTVTMYQELEEALDDGIDVALVDIRFPGPGAGDQHYGWEIQRRIATDYPDTIVIMFSAYVREMEDLRKAMRQGAFDYLSWPGSEQDDELQYALERAFEHREEIRRRKAFQISFSYLTDILAMLLERADVCTRDHTERVAGIAKALGEGLGLNQDTLLLIETAGRLHDLGKEKMSPDILKNTKPKKAIPADWDRQRKMHPEWAIDILWKVLPQDRASLWWLFPILCHHSARSPDREGYPTQIRNARARQFVELYDLDPNGDPFAQLATVDVPGIDVVLAVDIIRIADAIAGPTSLKPYNLTPENVHVQVSTLLETGTDEYDNRVLDVLREVEEEVYGVFERWTR